MTRRTSSFKGQITPLVLVISTVMFTIGHALKLGKHIDHISLCVSVQFVTF